MSSLALTYFFFFLFGLPLVENVVLMIKQKENKKKEKKNSFRCLRPIGDKHQSRTTEELSLLYYKKNRGEEEDDKEAFLLSFYPFLCPSLCKFQHVFTQLDTARARPHFVKSFVYVACLTTIINVHSPNGTSSLGFFSCS